MFHTAGPRDAGVPAPLGVTYRKSDPRPRTSRRGTARTSSRAWVRSALGDARARPSRPSPTHPRRGRAPRGSAPVLRGLPDLSRGRRPARSARALRGGTPRARQAPLSDRRAALERLERDLPATPEREAFADMRDAIRVAERGARRSSARRRRSERRRARPARPGRSRRVRDPRAVGAGAGRAGGGGREQTRRGGGDHRLHDGGLRREVREAGGRF